MSKNHENLNRKRYYNHANVSSGGTASIDLSFIGGEFDQNEKEKALADVIAGTANFMFEKGYIRFMSASDIAHEHGKSRQYWEKLIREGKIPYQQTRSGKITLNLWVEGYLKEKKEMEEYVKASKRMRDRIIEVSANPKNFHRGPLVCEMCGNKSFEYNFNDGHHINGVCRNYGCDFRIDTQK